MSGSVWMFSDQIDDEDMDFMRHEFVTYSIFCVNQQILHSLHYHLI